MKNLSLFILALFVSSLILTGCAFRESPAPIEYRHANASSKDNDFTIPTTSNDTEEIFNNQQQNNDYVMPTDRFISSNKKIIYHEVAIAETIEEIATKYNQTAEEIVKLNGLYKPYHLEEYQIIKIKVDKDFNQEQEAATEEAKPVILTFIQPVQGKLLSKFGEDTGAGSNKGINIAAEQGTKILASTSGKVVYASYGATFGYLIIVKVPDKNIFVSYAHMEDLTLPKGSIVDQGDVVGYIGSSGKVKTSQLHFAIRDGKVAKDPIKYFTTSEFN